MYCRLIVVSAMLLVCGIGRATAAPSGPPYYLALGDSLAIGIQASAAGLVATNKGYVDNLYKLYRLRHPNLRLEKLGCSGETTTSMLNGGKCPYDLGTQLAQAVEFIRTHRVVLITLSIGGDNVLGCFKLPAEIDQDCLEQASVVIGPELGQILGMLRAAAGAIPIVGMNYYDPFLAALTLGPAGVPLALGSLEVTNDLNDLLGTLYFAFQMPVADVARAYRINDFTPVPVFNVPLNVLLEFAWTWIGASPPVGPDIHPNAAGYVVIATAFVKAIGPL